MADDLYLLPPNQWPAPAPPPPSSRRGGWWASLLLGAVAVAAGTGVAVLGPDVVRDLRQPQASASVAVPSSAPDTTTTTTPTVTDPATAVYLITVDDCGLQGTGSGFAIDAHHVVTNAHVVQGDANPQLRSPTGERYVGRVVGLSGRDDDGQINPEGPPDVAVIELDVALPSRLVWASTPPGVGEVLVGMTFPEGVYTPTTGTVVANHAQGFEIRGDFDRGSSGGAVTSRDGQVHGIVTGGSDGGGRAFAFQAAVLRPIVDAILADPHPLPADCAQA
jgi:putative serine protease PepD